MSTNTWWSALPLRAKTGLVAGSVAVVLTTAWAGWALLRSEQAVLFSDLSARDAGIMAGELDRLKVPYTADDGGSTLRVDKSVVHATRLKLMGKDLPLHGAVGLELFNNADFGMSEFAQKINYQRALQGELTRTILSFPEVREVRVHLALPEQGLFRQASSRPKAAVTLTMKQGRVLRPEQVNGIQRLVAAAVPGLSPQEVTVVDAQGVALSRASGEGETPGAGVTGSAGGRMDLKRETEDYLARKAGAVLERAFGAGQALASVDVTLDMDQVRVTTEEVIAAPESRSGPPSGVLVRERESTRDSAAPDARGAESSAGRGSSMQREQEFQTGRRVEQVTGQPGAVSRIHVVAVVRQPLDAAQHEQVRQLVAAAVGASPQRGDTVVVQSLQSPAPPPAGVAPPPAVVAQTDAAPPLRTGPAWAVPASMVLLVAACVLLVLTLRRRPLGRRGMRALTDGERQAALRQVQAWLHDEVQRVGTHDGALVAQRSELP